MSGYGDNIQVDSTSNPISITGNSISHGQENGISILSASNVTVTQNHLLKDVGNGVYIGAPGSIATGNSTNNAIQNNTMKKNGGDGILTDTDSANNAVTGNTLINNHLYDLQDEGTSNSYTGNSCTPANDSSPAGLCG